MKKILIIILMGLCFYNIAFVLSFEKKYPEEKEIGEIFEIISIREETDYYYKYKCKNQKNDKFIFYSKNNYFPGDNVNVNGQFSKGDIARNYKGFNYRNYLKQYKIYGIIKSDKEEIVSRKKDIYFILAIIKSFLINQVEKNYDTDSQEFLKGILLGDTTGIENDIKESFRKSSISHVLAISGLHITYIVSGFEVIFSKIIKNKRKRSIVLCVFLIVFCLITGGSPSCIRACVMHIMIIISGLFYRKNNFFISLSLSFVILIMINPFYIYSTGMWLSYFGTFGVVVFSDFIGKMLKRRFKKIPNVILSAFSTSCSAQITIFPLMIYFFNTISISFFIPNILVSYIIGPVLIIGYISLLFHFKFIIILCEILVNLVLKIASTCEKIPFSKIYIKTPNIILIIVYYCILIYLIRFFHYEKFYFLRCVINKKFLNRKLIIILTIAIMLSNINIDRRLKIYFIDVGQGDCCVIRTPNNKTIIIDGGEDFDGRIVLPYLLDRGITKIDYIIISHFDSDHVGGLLKVMQELKVKNVVIPKQFQESENFETFKQIAKTKKINVFIVQKGNKINIEKNIYFDVLWPDSKNIINENVLNNNSIVCKFNYKEFSILFTGDIEEIAEKQILHEYNNDIEQLKSTALKIGHHGSKTSSKKEFLETVNPQIALIGVGINNKFGHPNTDVIQRIEDMRNKNLPYR